jgi:hypothetical protein
VTLMFSERASLLTEIGSLGQTETARRNDPAQFDVEAAGFVGSFNCACDSTMAPRYLDRTDMSLPSGIYSSEPNNSTSCVDHLPQMVLESFR